MFEASTKLLKYFSEYHRKLINRTFNHGVNFEDVVYINTETDTLFRFNSASVFIFGRYKKERDILVVTEHDGYYFFNEEWAEIQGKYTTLV